MCHSVEGWEFVGKSTFWEESLKTPLIVQHATKFKTRLFSRAALHSTHESLCYLVKMLSFSPLGLGLGTGTLKEERRVYKYTALNVPNLI